MLSGSPAATGSEDSEGSEVALMVGFRADAGGYTPAMIASEQAHHELSSWLATFEQQQQQQPQPQPQPPSTRGYSKLVLTGPLGKLEEEHHTLANTA